MDTTMQQLHLTQIEIMEVIDTFCQQHGIPYSLYAGSLLGAVRHRGFIPWDDDLDICMLRRDYERFIDLWQKSPPAGYLLQNKENAPNFGQSFTKIRKDHTTFLQAEKDIGKFHNGIFVDIFPMDRLPRGRMARKIFFLDCIFYLLYTRGYVPPRGNPVIKAVSHILLRCTPSAPVCAELCCSGSPVLRMTIRWSSSPPRPSVHWAPIIPPRSPTNGPACPLRAGLSSASPAGTRACG